jgi:hypothetical protein
VNWIVILSTCAERTSLGLTRLIFITELMEQWEGKLSIGTDANGDRNKVFSSSRLHGRMDLRSSRGDGRSRGYAR